VPLTSEITSVVVKCAPVLAIGLVRVVLVKGTQYPVSLVSFSFFFWLIKLLVNEGTRYRVRRALELFPNTGARTSVASFPASAVHNMPVSLLGLLVALGTHYR
jgi:hypothetical protein